MRISVVSSAGLAAAILLCGAPAAQAEQAAETRAGSIWDRLAHCEAGGNWSMNSGNGYYGGLQFDRGTWNSYGGDRFAAYPHRAPRDQQIAIASAVRDARGDYGAWPSCARKLGLPR